VIPFSLSTKSGFWYITAVDQDVQEIRTFRLDRIQGAIESKQNSDEFELPTELVTNPLEAQMPEGFATLDVRKGKCHSLRMQAMSLTDLGEWDQIKVPIYGVDAMTAQILWHGEDVFVQEPLVLRESVIRNLEALVKSHG
jgi:proteasome accessory factor B